MVNPPLEIIIEDQESEETTVGPVVLLTGDPPLLPTRRNNDRFLTIVAVCCLTALMFAGYDARPSLMFGNTQTTKQKLDVQINGPPVEFPEVARLTTATRRGPGGNYPDDEAQTQVLKISDKDEYFKIQTMQIHAAEALQCRESVINFVINATDAKDECDGLTRAFDKTCSDNDERANDRRKNGRQRRMKRRKLTDKLRESYSVHAWVYHVAATALRWIRFWGTEPQPFFFAEEEVLDAWSDAEYLVLNDLDRIVHKDTTKQMRRKIAQLHRRRQLSDLTSPVNKTKPVSLALPTAKAQLSEKTLSEAILLQQGDKLINQTTTKAMEEAATQSKALSDAADVVSAVLNDPSSIEARTCCTSILNVYHELCSSDDEEQISDSKLFFVVFVMALCGMVKSLIRHFKILWLPEAAGCILVGVLSGYILMLFPHHDFSFDGNWFLRILVPPIIFEAALSIDKRSFNRHVIPIIIYAVFGTILATLLTAYVVHRGTHIMSGWCSPIPYVEALTFGALISSIDPIAVLSVLSNMGMTDTDTIYVVIFGESLLNDGVAIVLFQTLVHFLDENLIIDSEAISAATVHFFVVAFGSLLVGVASGMLSTVYYWVFHGCQTPLVEVLMFFCWALLPYYICDGIGWSGIVAAVATGFFMDLHIVGQQTNEQHMNEDSETSSKDANRGRRRIFNPEGHLSEESRTHIGFVTEIISTMMETAIFAYLGLFLFSHRYHWNIWHALIAILACCFSRGIMIPTLSIFANALTRIQQHRAACRTGQQGSQRLSNSPAGVIIDRKMQLALWFAGLRGAMSFALVEHIPLYDSVSGEGTRLKPELKAMTSACIMFTVFVLGGYTYYMMQRLGIAPNNPGRIRKESPTSYEMNSLLKTKGPLSPSESDVDESERGVSFTGNVAFRRQRQASSIENGTSNIQ